MRKSRFTTEQIIQILREGQARSVKETVRRHGISEKTYYTWKAKYGSLGLTEARRLKQLEAQESGGKPGARQPAAEGAAGKRGSSQNSV